MEKRIGVVASLQVVIRDARAEVMNVMKADIPRKPLKYFGKFVKGASFKRCLCVIPIITSFPVDTIKLVLHIEQPNTGRTGNTDNDKLQEKISLKSKDKTHDRTHGENGEIHPVNRATLCFVRPGRRKTVPDKKQVKRSDDKQNKWVSGKAIREAAPARSFQILLNGHGHNVPNAAFVEMPGTGVVNVVFPAPMLGGRESQHSGDEPDDIIGATGFQVRAMATIVEDNKSSHEQTSREQSQREDQPPGDPKAEIDERPGQRVRSQGIHELPACAETGWPLKSFDDRLPAVDINLLGRRLHLNTTSAGQLEFFPE